MTKVSRPRSIDDLFLQEIQWLDSLPDEGLCAWVEAVLTFGSGPGFGYIINPDMPEIGLINIRDKTIRLIADKKNMTLGITERLPNIIPLLLGRFNHNQARYDSAILFARLLILVEQWNIISAYPILSAGLWQTSYQKLQFSQIPLRREAVRVIGVLARQVLADTRAPKIMQARSNFILLMNKYLTDKFCMIECVGNLYAVSYNPTNDEIVQLVEESRKANTYRSLMRVFSEIPESNQDKPVKQLIAHGMLFNAAHDVLTSQTTKSPATLFERLKKNIESRRPLPWVSFDNSAALAMEMPTDVYRTLYLALRESKYKLSHLVMNSDKRKFLIEHKSGLLELSDEVLMCNYGMEEQ